MDNLDTLFSKKQYDLILKLTEMSNDPKELLMRVSCLMILGQFDNALNEIDKNKEIIEKQYQLKLMKLHFELLLSKKLYDEAKIELNHYENLPYVSQEVEEFMVEIKERIEEEKHGKFSKTLDFEEIFETLENKKNPGKIAEVVFNLKKYNVLNFIESIKIFLKRNDVNPNFRSYVLILLVDQKFDEEIEFLSYRGIIKVNPSKLEPPFYGKDFDYICKKINELCQNNVSYKETSLHLFNCYIVDTYPANIYADNLDDLSKSFVVIAKQYFGEDIVNEEKNILDLANKITEIIESTPELKF